MESKIGDLKQRGISNALFNLVSDKKLSCENYFGHLISVASQNSVNCTSFSKLLSLDVAIKNLLTSASCSTWMNAEFSKLSDEKEIKVKSVMAELTAAGVLCDVFPRIQPIPVRNSVKTSDFLIEENIYVEVYCPQESQPERTKLDEKLDKQVDMVQIAISHPITGSNELALRFSANKTIDRVLNAKRSNNQTKEGAENILWIDLLNGFEVSCLKTLPYESINKGDNTFVGSFGIWHAFYGKKDESIFSPDRTSLKFLAVKTDFYNQKEDGLFRARKTLSAAILLASDGIVLFENPWANIPLSIKTKRNIARVFRFRPEYSYFGVNNKLEDFEIEKILLKIEWIYDKTNSVPDRKSVV